MSYSVFKVCSWFHAGASVYSAFYCFTVILCNFWYIFLLIKIWIGYFLKILCHFHDLYMRYLWLHMNQVLHMYIYQSRVTYYGYITIRCYAWIHTNRCYIWIHTYQWGVTHEYIQVNCYIWIHTYLWGAQVKLLTKGGDESSN